MSLYSEKIKSGLETMKPFSLIIAGVYVLYKNGYSLTSFSWTVAGGYGLVGLGAVSYTVDSIVAGFL